MSTSGWRPGGWRWAMATPDVQTLQHLGEEPMLLVFLAPRRFELMSPDEARELREQLDAALAQCAPAVNVGWVQRSEPHQTGLLEGVA